MKIDSRASSSHVRCLTVVSRYAALYAVYGVCFFNYLPLCILTDSTNYRRVLYETLRLFPPVVNIPKDSGQDNMLVISESRGSGETRSVPLPAGTSIALNIAALHYNRARHSKRVEY
jgi:hypothetical protein